MQVEDLVVSSGAKELYNGEKKRKMAKRQTDLIGFIHNVSPKKSNKSFRFQLQCDNSQNFKKAICFDTEKHDILRQKETAGEPVKLRKVCEESKDNFYADVVLNKATILDEVDSIKLDFERSHPVNLYVNLDHLFKPGSLISTKARLDLKRAAEKTVFAYGRNATVLNQAFLYDSNGSMPFSIWEEWIPYLREENKKSDYFTFNNLLVREWNGEMSLSTCSQTNISVCNENAPDVDIQLENQDGKSEQTIEEFFSVKDVLYYVVCGTCKNNIRAAKETLITCNSCRATMRTKNLKKLVELIVRCHEDDNNHYVIDAAELVPFMSSSIDPQSFTTDKEELIARVMEFTDICFSVDGTKLHIINALSSTEKANVSNEITENCNISGEVSESSDNV